MWIIWSGPCHCSYFSWHKLTSDYLPVPLKSLLISFDSLAIFLKRQKHPAGLLINETLYLLTYYSNAIQQLVLYSNLNKGEGLVLTQISLLIWLSLLPIPSIWDPKSKHHKLHKRMCVNEYEKQCSFQQGNDSCFHIPSHFCVFSPTFHALPYGHKTVLLHILPFD